MKSVLISIQPKWCELIASGKKTVEVRKTATRPTASPDSDEAQREFHKELKRYGLI